MCVCVGGDGQKPMAKSSKLTNFLSKNFDSFGNFVYKIYNTNMKNSRKRFTRNVLKS